MTACWEARTRRDQVLLAAMAAALVGTVLWLGAYRPAEAARRAAEQRYERALEGQARVARAAGRIQPLQGAAAGPVADVSAADAVNASARAAGVVLSRVEPDPAGGVQVAVQAVPPTALFPWLAALQRDYGVAARRLTVIKDDQGALSVDATFAEGS